MNYLVSGFNRVLNLFAYSNNPLNHRRIIINELYIKNSNKPDITNTHLEQLQYKSVSLELYKQKYIIRALNSDEYYMQDKNIADLIEDIKSTEEYADLLACFYVRCGRSINLSKYLSNSDLLAFYEDLTDDELYTLAEEYL
jgi:hypothetical protein